MIAAPSFKRGLSPTAEDGHSAKARKIDSQNSTSDGSSQANASEISARDVSQGNASSLSLSPEWRCVGPFPAGMCEQSFGPSLAQLSKTGSALTPRAPQPTAIPAAKVKVCDYDPDTQAHHVTVGCPREKLQGPMEAAGNAALQWQALSFTTFEVKASKAEHPQQVPDAADTDQPTRERNDPRQSPDSPSCSSADASSYLLTISVTGAEEFAVLRSHEWHGQPKDLPESMQWYRGDVYGYTSRGDAASRADHGHFIALSPGVYHLLVRSVYEVRLSGRPAADRPVAEITFKVAMSFQYDDVPGYPDDDDGGASITTTPPFFVYPSVVMGRFASRYVSFAMTNFHPTIALRINSIDPEASYRRVITEGLYEPPEMERILPPRTTRKITFELGTQVDVLFPPSKKIKFVVSYQAQGKEEKDHLDHGTQTFDLPLFIPIDHVDLGGAGDCAYRYTYLSGGSAQYAMIIPPRALAAGNHINILALHGAGVEADSAGWRTAIPRQEAGWILLPSGLTTWGLDWTMASREAYIDLLDSGWYLPLTSRKPSSNFYLIGHSNGGQGVLHALTHMTDRFQGGFIAAGYLNMQEYVNTNWQHARNVADPVLRGILQSALSVFSNDLFVSHLVDKRVTIKYGEKDDNVPPYHSRLLASLISQWARRCGHDGKASGKYSELIVVPGKGHWWDGVLSSPDVQRAIDESGKSVKNSKQIVVSTVVPSEMGYVHGIRILETEVPGRLARVEVSVQDDDKAIVLTTHGVSSVAVRIGQVAGELASAAEAISQIVINRIPVRLPEELTQDCVVYLEPGAPSLRFAVKETASPGDEAAREGRLLSPISLFLSAPRRIFAIVPSLTSTSKERWNAFKSVAERWAYAVLLYTTINVYIIDAADYNGCKLLQHDYVVFLGGSEENTAVPDRVISFIVHHESDGENGIHEFTVQNQTFSEAGTALLYSIGHDNRPFQDKAMVMTGVDVQGIERAGRLLPVRTGVPLPEWIVVGQDADRFGAGGVLAAGWYNNSWSWSPEMSYL